MTPDEHDARSHGGAGPAVTRGLLAVIAAILLLWFLRETYTVSMPVFVALFVAMVVHPVYAWLRAHLPEKLRWAAGILTLLLVVSVILLFAGAVALAVGMASEKAPQYAGKVQEFYGRLTQWASARGVQVEQLGSGGLQDRLTRWVTLGARTTGSVLSGLVLVLFLVLLMLLEARRWCERVRASLAGGPARATLDVVATVSGQVRQYLLVRTMLGAITAVIEGLWLWLAGVELALVWAMLFLLLNFIPTIGSVIAAIPPALAALVTLGPGRALLAIAGMFVIEQVMGNFVDPKLVGKRLSISPLVVLVAVVFWGWVWGVAGALLAVPMTVAIIVAFAHVRALRPVALLMSNAENEEELVRRTHQPPGT